MFKVKGNKMKDPKNCKNIEEIKSFINKIDKNIIDLISKRFDYVRESVKFNDLKEEILLKNKKEEIILNKSFDEKNDYISLLNKDIYKVLLSSFEKEEINIFEKNHEEKSSVDKITKVKKDKTKVSKTKKTILIALVGNYDEESPLHKLIPQSLESACDKLGFNINIEWIDTRRVNVKQLKSFDAIWCTPGAAYKSTQGALNAINFARVNNIPFLGTCAGYQHCILEFARTELAFNQADSSELNKNAVMPLIYELNSKLVEKVDEINLINNSKTALIYKNTIISENSESSYGLNPYYINIFDNSSMSFVGFNSLNEVKVLEIKENDFFIATAYLPEKSMLENKTHPLIEEFVKTAYNKKT